MAKNAKGDSPKEVVRKELDETGLVVTISTEKHGENLVGKLDITDSTTDNSILKIMVAGKPMDVSVSFGVSYSQEDIVAKLKEFVINSEFLKLIMPSMDFVGAE
jgi:phage tail sheath gpL-like